MRFLPVAAAFAIALSSPAHAFAQEADSVPRFPPVTGHSLQGGTVQLPAGFAGERNLVFIAFRRDQQRDVDSWRSLARELTAGDPRLQVYELPTLARGYRFVRPMMEAGMRRGIPDTTTRAHTILLFIDKGPFERALHIGDEHEIAAVLLDHAGMVRWTVRGPLTPALADSLRAAVARP